MTIIAAGAVLLCVTAYSFGDISGGCGLYTLQEGVARVIYSFFAGIAIYRLWASGRFTWLRIHPAAAVLILIGIMTARPEPRVFYDLAVILFAFPVLVLASTADPGPRFQRICTALGLISYPIYALHETFARLEMAVVVRLHVVGRPALLLEILFLAAMAAFALLIERFVDRAARRWLTSRIPVPTKMRRVVKD